MENKRVVIVTGGARGIGKNIAALFASKKDRVVIVDVNRKEGFAAAKSLSGNGSAVTFLHADLQKKGAAQQMIKSVVREHGRLDILINNARSGVRADLLTETEKSWDFGMSVTLKAAFFASQEAVRAMSKSGGGSIVNICSLAALTTCPESPVYHIAKAGMLQMTRFFASSAGKFGVRVNAVLPGFIVQDEHLRRYLEPSNADYRRMAEFCHPRGKVGASDEIARVVAFLCSADAAFVTGQGIVADGGLSNQEPTDLLRRYVRAKKGRS